MAAIVEDTCAITDASEKEDSAVRTNTASFKLHDSEQTLSHNQSHCPTWRIENGSLPVAVPENQVGPGFHYVESSTTDSGVSNASSVTSDCVPIPHLAAEMSVPPAELLRTVERVLRSGSIEEDASERGNTVSGLPRTEPRGNGSGERGGEAECGEGIGDLSRLEMSKNPQLEAEDTRGSEWMHSV